jgi:peptidoglycan pentaglycine glycine transferase (the first glycine)
MDHEMVGGSPPADATAAHRDRPRALRLRKQTASMAAVAAPRVVIDTAQSDEEWDAFVNREGGSHQQTSLWGQVKAIEGWSAVRIKVYEGARSELVGGGQILVRKVAGIGGAAFVPRGPIVAGGHGVLDLVLTHIGRVARRHRCFYLRVQPPTDGWGVLARLDDAGYLPSRSGLPEAIATVDLRPGLDSVLAGMSKSTRRYIRGAEARGVHVRHGGLEDLPTFWRCLAATAERQGFEVFRSSYYDRMWKVFSKIGSARLLIAEHEARALSAVLLIGVGDTVEFKAGGWSGERGDLHPNEALHWAGIQWAHESGYSWYDFEGIDRRAATALLDGTVSRSGTKGITRFKLGFGAEPQLVPPARHRSPWPGMTTLLDRLEHGRSGKLLGNRVAGRRPSSRVEAAAPSASS